MSTRRGNLQAAHRGYRYQDIATAYVLVRAMVERYDAVIVDRKQVDDDRIDDVEVRTAGRLVRQQFKSSQDATRPLSEADFTGSTSSLRIDRELRGLIQHRANAARFPIRPGVSKGDREARSVRCRHGERPGGLVRGRRGPARRG